jgi:flagellar biogenesis protein FliO
MGIFLFPFALHAQTPGVTAAPDSLAVSPSFITSDVKLFFQLIFGLAIVIILLILTLWVLRFIMRSRLAGAAGVDGDAVTVLTIRYLDPRKAVALVRVMDRVFIIGVADQSLTTLGELTPEEAGALQRDATNNQQVFAHIFDRIWRRRSNPS